MMKGEAVMSMQGYYKVITKLLVSAAIAVGVGVAAAAPASADTTPGQHRPEPVQRAQL
jgi:hypothetical protein